MIKKIQKNRGMTYVELIVVLAIFGIMSTVVLYNYGEFQDRVDIKNMASDIALKIVQAQKASLNGQLPDRDITYNPATSWKPSYGVYFNLSFDDKSFIYFSDLNQDGQLDSTTCSGSGECLDQVFITKGDRISDISYTYLDGTVVAPAPTQYSAITFKRPDSTTHFYLDNSEITGLEYFQITLESPKSKNATITVYPSGRIQVN